MINVLHRYTTLYMFKRDHARLMDPYDAICGIQWESEEVVWIVGFHGSVTRTLLRELVAVLVGLGIRWVKAHRAEGRVLPYGKDMGDHWLVDLKEITKAP